VEVEAVNFRVSAETLDGLACKWTDDPPDVVLCPFDRPEMVPVAYSAYHYKVPIAQIFAGDIAGGAFDDAERFVISNYARWLFCADYPQAKRVRAATRWKEECGLDRNIVVVGATHFDDMTAVNEQEPRKLGDYTLVLYNPPSLLDREGVEMELGQLQKEVEDDELVLWADPNGDANSDIVEEFAEDAVRLGALERTEFLSFLKNANRIVGNSSCMFYEAVYFDVPYKQIGVRNRYREPIPKFMCKPGASRAVIEALKEGIE